MLKSLQYLVGTSALIDLARSGGSIKWGAQIHFEECGLSVISLGQALSMAERMDTANSARNTWFHHINTVYSRFERHDGLLAVNKDTILMWSKIRHLDLKYFDADGAQKSLPPDYSLILATAIERNLTLIEKPQEYHKVLAPLGLRIEEFKNIG